MRPYFYDYSHRPPYPPNINTQPIFNNPQHWTRHDWQNVWSRGWSESQNQYNYHGPTPHYGWGMENGGCGYTPQQTARPTIPVVAPEQQRPLPQPTNHAVAPEQQRPLPQPPNHAIAPEQQWPLPQPINPVVAPDQQQPLPQPINPVVAPEQRPLPQPINPVVAPEQRPLPQPTNPSVAPEQRPQPQPTNPVVDPEQRPRPRPTNPVLPPEQRQRPRPRPTNPVLPPEQRPWPRPQRIVCRICGVRLSSERDIELHNNGKKHRNLLRLHEESKQQKAINGQKSGQMPKSPMHLAVQPKTDNRSNRNGYLVENVSSESTVDKHKGCLKKNTGEISKVPANIPLQTARPTNPVVDPKRQPHPNPITMCHICGVRLSSEKNIEQHNNGFRHQSMLRLKSDKQKGRNGGESGQMPNSLMDSVLRPKAVNKSKNKGCLIENARSKSTPNKHKDYLKKNTEETSKVSSQKRQREPRDSFVAQGNNLKRKIGGDEYKEKGEWKRRATESSKPDVSTFSKCVESLVQEPAVAQPEGHVALQELSPVPAVRSSFEPQNDRVLQPELEHQVSETIAHNESLNPTDQANVQQPSVVTVEFDAPVNSNTSTETADGSFQAEEKMDVCITEKWNAPLSQVNVCLKCGNQGFQETLVFCNKCHIYALHRYCLDGPVVFTEDVTWFCEDCEPVVVVVDSINNNKTSIKKAEENKQQQQNIVAERMDQLHDGNGSFHHGLSQCSNECDGENKVEKESQLVLKDAVANSCEETVENSPAAATSDVIDPVELEGHAVAEPIIDPIWRGRFHLHNQGTGTFNGLLAHLSSLACCRVLEETRLLPEELSVDMLERSEVWPNSFKKCGPDHDSIALFFFPENERAEKDFDELVDDIIQFDHAMRVVLEHAELLVFPSTLLPIQYRRFQAKYYLWGVFKAKKI